MKKNNVESRYIRDKDLADLICWARRYCDFRTTFAPSSFNLFYKRFERDNPEFCKVYDKQDIVLMENGRYWPYAQDGNYNEKTGDFDARK